MNSCGPLLAIVDGWLQTKGSRSCLDSQALWESLPACQITLVQFMVAFWILGKSQRPCMHGSRGQVLCNLKSSGMILNSKMSHSSEYSSVTAESLGLYCSMGMLVQDLVQELCSVWVFHISNHFLKLVLQILFAERSLRQTVLSLPCVGAWMRLRNPWTYFLGISHKNNNFSHCPIFIKIFLNWLKIN